MIVLFRRFAFFLALVTILLVIGLIYFSPVPLSQAQGGTGSGSAAAGPPPDLADRPFQLPFAEPPGSDTWLLGQPYGNTTGSYRQRYTTYGASGGIHFGVDLSAPCGTEAVAIADGIVFAVDGPFGSPPHNLMIDHPELGYASLYGHLLEAPAWQPGTAVKQGQVVALTGDSGETCYGRPHLHLEIRDLNHVWKFNPTLLIEANWDSLALVGDTNRTFARDLDEPRKWQTLYDQPIARTGGPILNDFANPWPFDWEKQTIRPVTSAGRAVASPGPVPATITGSLAILPVGRQLTQGSCCTELYWRRDSGAIRFIDQPKAGVPVGLWQVALDQTTPALELVTERLGVYSPDGQFVAYPNAAKGVAVVERLADGRTWEFDTQGRNLSFTPSSRQVIWTAYDEDAPRDTREETVWLAEATGGTPRVLYRARRTSPMAWLSDNSLLMSRRLAGTSDIQLYSLALDSGRQTTLLSSPRMRGLSLSPDRRYLAYYVAFEPEPAKNGTWLLDLQNPARPPKKLPFFGTYRWWDNERLIYVPLDPEATSHDFYEYNLLSETTTPLFPEGTNLTIANNDWQVSPDGRRIALLAAAGPALDGIWLLDLNDPIEP